MYLHEPPAEEGGHEKSEDVEGQARDLSVRAALPVVGEEVDAARTLRGQSAELLVEVVCVELEHRVGEHATSSELRIILTIWKPPQAVAMMWVRSEAALWEANQLRHVQQRERSTTHM